ncbi:MAG: MnhB domain-containing protein [Firmicutes bacterium]|jgi:multicomponent Na+:H+ antiporter subunit B|nr:MnhB domain-containing protein [Bacillota bacterium]
MDSKILNNISRIIIPFIQILGCYIILTGHLLPGGGFSGGTILGCSFLIEKYFIGESSLLKYIEGSFGDNLLNIAMLSYILLKLSTYVLGLHIDWREYGQIIGGGSILILNIVVGIVVALALYKIIRFIGGDELARD